MFAACHGVCYMWYVMYAVFCILHGIGYVLSVVWCGVCDGVRVLYDG